MKKVFLLLVILFSINGFACSCDIKPPVKQSFDDAKEVFIAKIVNIDSTHLSDYGKKIYLYDVRIIHFFKKDPHNRSEEIRTFFYRNSIGGCDFEFISGEEYLIYEANGEMNHEKSMNYASACSRTALLSYVKKEEINELEKLSKTKFKEPKSLDILFPTSITIKKEEYQDLQKQAINANDLALKNTYLMVTVCLLSFVCLIFIFLYIKTKKKLQSVNKS